MKKIFLKVFVEVLALSLLGLGPVVASAQEKVSKPGVYSGYSQQIYDGWKRFSRYVAVQDGTKLAMDYYRPTLTGVVVEKRLPVIFVFTPYRRASYASGGIMVLSPKNSFSHITPDGLLSLVKYGYVVAVADCRGTNASYGVRKATNNQVEAGDARDLIEWLAVQQWSDGNVGMWGCSYVGGTVHEAIRMMPPHLKAGILDADFNAYDAKGIGGLLRGPSSDPDYKGDLVAIPVDEDILDANNNGYKDMLEEAVEQHKNNPKQVPFVQSIPFRNSWSDISGSTYWQEISASNYLSEIERSGVAAYIYGGWYDFLRRDTVLMFTNWPNPKKMLVGPWPHCGNGSNARGCYNNDFNFLNEIHRFFDYWLKGIGNGIMDEPPIYYMTENRPTGMEWRFGAEWPIPHEQQVTYFFQAGPSGTASSVNDGILTTTAPTGAGTKDDYTAVYTITTSTDWYAGGIPRPTGKELDQKGLTYTTAPLEADLEVTGHPIVNLWITSTAPDAGLFFTLEDVDPSGNSIYVGDGRLRASLRSIHTPPFNKLGLPWHRCFQEDEQKLVSGQMVQLVTDMLPTSYVFKQGHRIRFVITALMAGWFVNPPKYDPPPVISVYRDANHPAFITLPVIPPKLTVFEGNAKVRIAKTTYEGPAKLYTFTTAVYLNYGDSWLKWDVFKTGEVGNLEQYRGEGELGRLLVLVVNNERLSFDALAIGNGIYFKGNTE